MKRRRHLLYETELSWFILVGALDVFMTYLLLRFSAEGRTQNPFIEGNPVARWVLHRWGLRGMVIFKFAMIALVAAIAEFVGQQRSETGRNLLRLGTLIVGGVVIYSLKLMISNL
ncbi:MAG: DUF5658 family protein [Planctomycetaceae bacterium]